jgi:hypothetical protein
MSSAQGNSSFDSFGSSSAFMVGPDGTPLAGGLSGWGSSGSQVGVASVAGTDGGTSNFLGTTTGMGMGGFTGGFNPADGIFGAGGGSAGTLDILSSVAGTAGDGTADATSTGAGSTSGGGSGFEASTVSLFMDLEMEVQAATPLVPEVVRWATSRDLVM